MWRDDIGTVEEYRRWYRHAVIKQEKLIKVRALSARASLETNRTGEEKETTALHTLISVLDLNADKKPSVLTDDRPGSSDRLGDFFLNRVASSIVFLLLNLKSVIYLIY